MKLDQIIDLFICWDSLFHVLGETYIHMAPAMATECAVDDKLQDNINASLTDHESKNASPSVDSTSSGENVYAQIQ